jgi:triacylglycerol esterase/lipase EstA (alpha/beta hydrolase family)
MRRLAVLAASLAALVVVPAAAQARTDDFSKPVLFVPGPEDSTCEKFLDAEQHLQEYTTTVQGVKIGFSGEVGEVGLYAVSPGCIQTLGAGREDSVAQLGARLASWIKAKYANQPIDVVAHGGGGLVLRSALAQEPSLRIEDAVAIGAPNAGSSVLAAKCGTRSACAELGEGSATIKALAKNPQGAGGTDWSVIGSESDSQVTPASAIAMDAEHKTIYRAAGPSHDGLLSDVSDTQDARIRYSHGASAWVEWNQAPHPVERVAEDLIFGAGSTPGACGLQATQPELCGKTPVILVPGFGASQIVCGADEENMWPGAMFNMNYWNLMSLGSDGRTPWHNDNCSRTSRPNGHLVYSIKVAGFINAQNIHGDSWAWVQRIAPGRAYEFGWDFRKGPEETLERLDKFIDEVRAKHGVERVALVAHSYGGLLSRWYIDEPARARKVARVANFGSPFWGAPKAWFAMAYGYEQPGPSPIDLTVDNHTFRRFSTNLTGLYYLIPPQAWFDRAPAPLRNWLEVDEKPVKDVGQAVDAVRAFGGNGAIAAQTARNHAEHIDGFKRTNGVDWRIFVGSGRLTMGHVRAYSGSDEVQYSWINGDGTVPLFSQRQYGNGSQMGDKTPTYNFCDIAHMGEMEDPALQAAVTPFVADGSDPIVDGTALRSIPCSLDGTEFKVTGDEDARSIAISKAANASAASVPGRAHAAQAASGTMTLDQAEAAGLVEAVKEPGRTVFVTSAKLTVQIAGKGMTQVTPITGEGKPGTSRVYDGPVVVTADGAKSSSASPSRAADRKPPRTTAKLRRGRLTLTAKDGSGVAVTMVKVGKAKPRPFKKAVKVKRGATVRYWSIDTFGNAEKARTVR